MQRFWKIDVDDLGGGTGGATPITGTSDEDAKLRSEEAAKYRLRAKTEAQEKEQYRQKVEELMSKVQEFENQGRSEQEKFMAQIKDQQAKLAEYEQRVKQMEQELKETKILVGVLKHPESRKLHDPGDALKYIKYDNLEVDEEGFPIPTALDEQFGELRKSRAYVYSSLDDDEGKGKEGGGEQPPPEQPSGQPFNGQRGQKDGMDMASLANKYPSLRNRVRTT